MIKPSIFRQEALDAQVAGQHASGEPLRADSRWLRCLFWAVLVLVLAGVATALFVRIDATATGPAVVHDDGTFYALIPAGVASELEDARSVRIESVGGADAMRAVVAVKQVVPVDKSSLSRAHLPAPRQPSILLSGSLPSRASSPPARRHTEIEARAVVVLRSESILGTLGRRVGGMLG